MNYLALYRAHYAVAKDDTVPHAKRVVAGCRGRCRRTDVTLEQKWSTVAKLQGYVEAFISVGKRHEVQTYEQWCEDVPIWTLPGFSLQDSTPRFWMQWPVIIDGALMECHAVYDQDIRYHFWLTWRGPPGGQMEFIGIFDSMQAARRATGAVVGV